MENRKNERGLETPLWWLTFSNLSTTSQKETVVVTSIFSRAIRVLSTCNSRTDHVGTKVWKYRVVYHPKNFFLGFPDMNCSKTNWATSFRFTSSNATASWEIIWDRASLQRVLHTHSSRKAFSWGPMLRPPSCTRSLSPTPRKVPSWDHSSPFSLYATRRSSRSLRQSVERNTLKNVTLRVEMEQDYCRNKTVFIHI